MTGIERIQRSFARRLMGKKCLTAFLTAGDPSIQASKIFCREALNHVDLLEIGIPFSDPMADGPVIQGSYCRALSAGICLHDIQAMVRRLREETDKPILFMVYMNIILQCGPKKFFQEAVENGVDGLIIPDLPPEEADEMLIMAQELGLGLVFLVAPTSTTERLKLAAEKSAGFLYCVSLRGVTGIRSQLAVDLPEFIGRIRQVTELPLAVGFGISGPAQAREVSRLADGVIVGSALVRLLAEEVDIETAKTRLGNLLEDFKKAMD